MIIHSIDIDPQIRKAALQRGKRVGSIGRKAAFPRQEIAHQREVINWGHAIRLLHHARNPQNIRAKAL
jgi:hypothetical protein